MDATTAPHPDIELTVDRSMLGYSSCVPETGVNRETGLVLFLAGYGMDTRGAYTQNLLSYLANKHNCVAASVEYFGAKFMYGADGQLVPHPAFFQKLKDHYGLSITVSKGVDVGTILSHAMTLLSENGVTTLNQECTVIRTSEEYNSMGFLPALDGLQIVHVLSTTLRLNRARLFLLGTSYGGYIAGLMSKLAPHTFRMIVDNSGFSSAEDDLPSVLGWHKVILNGVGVWGQTIRHWSSDPAADNFFSEERRAIRNLLNRDHVLGNTARTYAFHSATDINAPTERKTRLRDVYEDRVPYDLVIVDDGQIDGRIFKHPGHGMGASMRGIFEISYEKFMRAGGALSDETDFDQGSQYVFACGKESYVVSFSLDHGVRAQIRARELR